MTTRTTLPNRREAFSQTVLIGGQKLYLTVGFYDKERTQVGELFIIVAKTGSYERALLDEVARGASKRLQLGEPLEELAEDWLGTRFEPCGPVQGDAHIRNCLSPLDFVARHLLIRYCNRMELSHVPAAESP